MDAAERAIRRAGSDVTMAQIAAEAGLTKPALYASFPNKGALANALAERVALDLGSQLAVLLRQDRPARTVLREVVDTFCGFVEREPALYGFLVQGAAGLGRRFQDRRLVMAIGDLASFGLGTIMVRAGHDAEPAGTWARAIVGALFYTLDWWSHTQAVSRDDLVDYLTDAAWAVMALGGAERIEGPIVAAKQPSIYRDVITGNEDLGTVDPSPP
jgi:AcrR family transcriptional regulator